MNKQDLNDAIGTGLLVQAAEEIGLPTLRDRFAMSALVGMLSSESDENGHYESIEKAAQVAYKYADAMLEARKSKEADHAGK